MKVLPVKLWFLWFVICLWNKWILLRLANNPYPNFLFSSGGFMWKTRTALSRLVSKASVSLHPLVLYDLFIAFKRKWTYNFGTIYVLKIFWVNWKRNVVDILNINIVKKDRVILVPTPNLNVLRGSNIVQGQCFLNSW